MISKYFFRSILLSVLWTCVSCQGPGRGSANQGFSATTGATAREEDAVRLTEWLAIENWESRQVSVEGAKLGSPMRLVYQAPGDNDLTALNLYPATTNSTMVLALKQAPRTPLQVMQLWRPNATPTPLSVRRGEIDPPPPRTTCYWSPALTNVKPGSTVVAVWPGLSGSVSFDPTNTNFRARLVLVVQPSQ